MVPAVTKQEIPRVVQISAQSEQLCERYSKFDWFLKIACLRYEGPWGQDCVSGVRPCLVHSQNLSELIVHFDGGQNPYRTAVRTWFVQLCSCCCLSNLPQLACNILANSYKFFFRAQYSERGRGSRIALSWSRSGP